MDDRDPTLCRAFVSRTKAALTAHPDLPHTWSIDDDEDHCTLDFPETSPEGFPITVEVYPREIIVFAKGFHQHFEYGKVLEEPIESSLGLVRDLLSPAMRIRECLSDGWAYRWVAEHLHNGDWVFQASTGLLFWSYFGKRTEKIYQNRSLEAR